MAKKSKAKKPVRARGKSVKAKAATRPPKKTQGRRKTAPAAASRQRPPARASGGVVSRAVRAVIDTVTGTDKLRNKMEPRGTTETE